MNRQESILVETDTPPDALDGTDAGTTESIRWIGILILLALLSILVAVWAVAPRPVWSASEVVLFVLAALLFSLVAIFLAVSEYHEWLVRTQEGVRPIVAELRRLQETQTRLDATVGKGHQELTTLARQAERTQREPGGHLAGELGRP